MNKLKLSWNDTWDLIALCASYVLGYFAPDLWYVLVFALGSYLAFKFEIRGRE